MLEVLKRPKRVSQLHRNNVVESIWHRTKTAFVSVSTSSITTSVGLIHQFFRLIKVGATFS